MRASVGECMLGVLLTLFSGSGTAAAQQELGDSASQRILPLPEGKLSDAQTQMQLLQRLRSLVAASENAVSENAVKSEVPSPDDTPTIDDKQLEQLQQALKRFQDLLPLGIKPPDLGSIPKEQLDEAMSNPAMQQQLKKLLEQFSKDGLLPKNGGDDGDSSLPPIPQRPGQFPTQPPTAPPGQASPSAKPGDQSWESLKNAMKQLSEIAQGGKINPPQNDETNPGVDPAGDHKDASTRPVPQPGINIEPQPRADQPRADQPRADVQRVEGESHDDEIGNRETQQPSLQAFQDLLKRYKDSQRNQQPSSDGTSGPAPDETRPPEVRPGMRSPRTEDDESAQAPNRNGDGSDQRAEQQTRNSSESRSSDKSLPSVSEFLKEQLRKGFPTPGTNEDVGNSRSPSIRSELQKRGVRGTLDKIIEKAKEESKAQRKAQQQAKQESIANQTGTDASRPRDRSSLDAQTKSPGGTGLQKNNWLTDRLLGMEGEVDELIKDAKFQERSAESRQNRNSTRQQSPTDSDSRINKWNDAASDFLSDLSKAPSAPAAPRSSSGGDDSDSADAPLAIGPFFLVGLGLLGIMAVAAFMMRRPLLKLVSDACGIAGPGRIHQPSEICSREDVITAFHELALNPKKLVESWWTHRAAATKLAAESPQQGNAVRTLAEIYEQARYLPDDVELPAEKIQSARTAFSECR